MDSPIDCQFLRRFGIELEVNTLTGIIKRPDSDSREIPVGADYVAHLVHKSTRERVELQGWDHIHNNKCWIVKPDMSCGIEINSPILKGWTGLEKILKVIDTLRDAGINADRRCSLHVHVNIADLEPVQLASVIAHYIKCEHVLFDAIPPYRKNNRYCQLLGLTDLFYHDFPMDDPMEIIHRISAVKYYSLNAYHFIRGGGFSDDNQRKKTLEFRIAEGLACIDSLLAKNWIRFFLHFVEMTKNRPLPRQYRRGDPWSSLLWLNPSEVFSLLKFDQDEITPGIRQIRDWFVLRIAENGYNTGLGGIWSNQGRSVARKEIEDFIEKFKPQKINDEDAVYGKNYIL